MPEPSLQTLLDVLNGFKTDTENNFKSIKEDLASIGTETTILKERVDTIEETQNTIVYEIELLKQKPLNTNLRIVGIPLRKEENLSEIVVKIANTIGVQLRTEDIESTYRTPGRAIIVRFNNEDIKYEILKAKAQKKALVIDELELGLVNGESEISINHHLSPYFASILYLARQAIKRGEAASAWFSKKGICIKLAASDTEHHLIKSTADLHELIPSTADHNNISPQSPINNPNHKRKASKEPELQSHKSKKNTTTATRTTRVRK